MRRERAGPGVELSRGSKGHARDGVEVADRRCILACHPEPGLISRYGDRASTNANPLADGT